MKSGSTTDSPSKKFHLTPLIRYRHSRMFVAGIYSFTGWIPAKNIPE
jgi:hypothetical protein